MKIRKLQLKNIGVFDDEEIIFKTCPEGKAEIHIFTGENGSGKTTILQALASTFDNYEDDFSLSNLRNSLEKRFQLLKSNNEGDITNFIYVYFDEETNSIIGLQYNQFYSQLNPSTFSHKVESKHLVNKYYAYPLESYRMHVSGKQNSTYILGEGLSFAAFVYSGYRRVEDKRIEALSEPKDFNPLAQSLNFVKDYSQIDEISINQLLANNISKSAIEKERNKEKSKKFADVIRSIEKTISEITGWKVEFDLETEPTNLITKVNGEELDFDVLPDGLRSLISWIADLLGRVDLLKWQNDLPIFEKNLILLLDEIEVHLHPAWQRKVLPVVQKLFKNSQIFVSTHSPFVVNSVDDAWVYKLELENGKAKVSKPIRSEDGISYQTVLSEIFGIDKEFGGKTQDDLDKFYGIVRNGKKIDEKELRKLAKSLAVQSEELNAIVQIELRQLSRRKGKEFSI
jgi:predicted ATP-binding protein involved in virulence